MIIFTFTLEKSFQKLYYCDITEHFEVKFMYHVTKEIAVIENCAETLFGISDGNVDFPCLTSDCRQAENLAELLNKNGVEPNHLVDVVEDMFYT